MLRIGIDLGGTKIEAALIDECCDIQRQIRTPTPQNDYDGTIYAIAELIDELESPAGLAGIRTGICTPGAVSPITGLMKNANSTCLNHRPFHEDLEASLGRPVRIANDADCLAASELNGGALAGCDSGFAVILGTGVGGGVIAAGELLHGANAIAGEWGHNPLPWPTLNEVPGPTCWCGQQGCIETWLCGPGMMARYIELIESEGGSIECMADVGPDLLVELAGRGNPAAAKAVDAYMSRLARALASVVNVLDPQCIVVGGGLSQIDLIYETVPRLWLQWIFSDRVETRFEKARFGDSSGIRGAAALWPPEED